jgi:pyrroloquinoline quinone biosynthesis protein D
MSDALSRDAVVRISPTYRFQWEPAQNAHVLLYPEGMVKLNPSAAEILKHCDGQHTISQIIDDLKAQFEDADLEADVLRFLQTAQERGWIKIA